MRTGSTSSESFSSDLMRSGGLRRLPGLCTRTRTPNDSPTVTFDGHWASTCAPQRLLDSHETPSSPTRPAPTTCIHTLPVWPASANIRPAPVAAAHPFGAIRTRRTSAESWIESATDRYRHRGQHLRHDRTPHTERIEAGRTRTVGLGDSAALQHQSMAEHIGREYFYVVRHDELAVIDERARLRTTHERQRRA